MSLNPRVCKKSYKVHIPMMGEACEFWLITVTDEQSITNPDKDHAYLTDDGKLFVFNGDSLVRVNCDICFTQEERDKLEGIEENANNYTLPEADSNKLGGVILGYTQNGKNYPVVKDSDGKIYVQVPWVDYALPKAEDDQLGGIKTGYKQNGKYYPVKVDTDGNAYVNIPWSDTNTVYEVVSNTSDGLAPMLPSENPDKKYLNGDGEWIENDAKSIEINGVNVTGSFYSGETSDCGVQITRVVGKTSQKTTNGYQLFDASKVASKTQGGATVINNNDGSFTISGSGTLSERYVSDTPYTDIPFQLKVGKLFLLVEASTYPCCYIYFADENGAFVTYISLMNGGNTAELSLSSETVSRIKKYKPVFVGNVGGQIKTGTIKPMLYQDGDGTWEEFTGGKPAPNPDYAMPIENVEISEITSHGRNLLPYPYYCDGIGVKDTQSGINFEILPDKSFKLSGTATSICYINLARIDFGGNEFSVSHYIGLVGNTDDNIVLSYNANNKITSIYISPNATVDTIVYPMISKGKQVPEWEAPTGYNTVETSLTLAEDDVYEVGVITRKMKEVNVTRDFAFSLQGTYENTLRFDSQYLTDKKSTSGKGYCNLLPKGSDSDNGDYEHFRFSSANKGFVIYINKSRLETPDVSGLAKYLDTAGMKLLYELDVPTTETLKVPTIPSYYPYTEVSTDSKVEPEITFKPLSYTTCLVGEATEEESGYMPKLSGNASQFLNGQGKWTTPSGYTLPTASSSVLGGVKIGSNISISSGTISIDKDDVTGALGYTPPTTNTTYEKVDKSSDGLCPKLPNETTTTKYLRQDGAWAVPPNTTYGVASTSADGLMSSSDKTKLTNLRRIWKGTSSSPPSGWVDGDIYVQYEE